MNTARLIIDEPADGVWNMAVDQALLQSAEDSDQITLRLYRWSRPTLSLGYFQKYEDRKLHAGSLDCDVVRRKTGGGAILHDSELTYSLAVPRRHRWSQENEQLYDLVHQAIIGQLTGIGLNAHLFGETETGCDETLAIDGQVATIDAKAFLCFERRTSGDVVCGGWKIVGSAQRRLRSSLLQHGSILLTRSKWAPELPGIEDLSAKALESGPFMTNIVKEIAASLHFEPSHGRLSQEEWENAKRIESEFRKPSWIQQR